MAVFSISSYDCSMKFEHYVLDLIDGKRSSPLVSCFFALISRLYRFAILGRHLAYRKKWLPTFRVSVPTVSIGNLVVGGTGKTPLVQMLANALEAEGKIAILTRGFRSKAEKALKPVCINGAADSDRVGDEPLLLARTTRASVWVGADRVLSAQQAEAEGAACLILDDGFQHRRLLRDIDIVAVDANNPVGRGRLMPYGLLRDVPERLKEADLIVATHTSGLEHYEQVKKELSRYTQAPIMAMRHVLNGIEFLKGRLIGAFCGIGRPDYFFDALQQAGAQIVFKRALLDHEGFTEGELDAFAGACQERGALDLVCTEKDWVKLSPAGIDRLAQVGVKVFPIAVRLEMVAGQEHWDQILEKIKQKIKVSR